MQPITHMIDCGVGCRSRRRGAAGIQYGGPALGDGRDQGFTVPHLVADQFRYELAARSGKAPVNIVGE